METRAKRRDIKSKVKAATSTPEAKEAKEFSIPMYNSKGKEVGTFALNKKVFDGIVNKQVLYQAVLMYNANSRQGNASTKTRGDVSGGGKKPWRQKGTGRARAGSTRSPLWRHGGVVFGPHPREFRYQIPMKMKRLALLSSINSKLNENKMIGIDALSIDEPKTKKFKAILEALKLKGRSLFVLDDASSAIKRASRNLQEVRVKNYRDFNTMDVLNCDTVVMSKGALEYLPKRIKGQHEPR